MYSRILCLLLLVTLSAHPVVQAQQPRLNEPAIFTFDSSFIHNRPDYLVAHSDLTGRKKSCRLYSNKLAFDDAQGSVVLPRETVFGYRDESGFTYRFVGRNVFKIEDTAGFYVYSRYQPGCRKTFQSGRTSYYFSVLASGDLKKLSLKNILDAFVSNRKFCDTLLKTFPSPASLSHYSQESLVSRLKELYTACTAPGYCVRRVSAAVDDEILFN